MFTVKGYTVVSFTGWSAPRVSNKMAARTRDGSRGGATRCRQGSLMGGVGDGHGPPNTLKRKAHPIFILPYIVYTCSTKGLLKCIMLKGVAYAILKDDLSF